MVDKGLMGVKLGLGSDHKGDESVRWVALINGRP